MKRNFVVSEKIRTLRNISVGSVAMGVLVWVVTLEPVAAAGAVVGFFLIMLLLLVWRG